MNLDSDPSWRLRPYQESDFEAESRIENRLHPDTPVTPEETRHWDHLLDVPGIYKLRLAAEERRSGSVVGTSALFNAPWAFDPDRYWIGVSVDPDSQRRGLGRFLYKALEEAAVARRAKLLWASALAQDPRSFDFWQKSGFVERRRVWTSRLDLSQVPPGGSPSPSKDPQAGEVEITSIAREGAEDPSVQARLYRVDVESGRDAPRLGPATEWPFDQFLAMVFRGPGSFPEGALVAKVRGEYVAYTYLQKRANEPDTLYVGFTGTLPSFRRRGIATRLKRQAVEVARSLGYRYLVTNNDSTNQRIWPINEALGFRPFRTWIEGEKILSSSNEPASPPGT